VAGFKFGCLPGKIPVGLRDLTYYVAGDLPAAPAQVTVPAVVSWGMDGNDQYGDCGVAGINHYFMADASITSTAEVFPDAQQVVDYYLTYTGGQDAGVVLSDFLAYVRRNGFCGHTVAAYAPVGVHDIPVLQFAVDAYGAAYTGITVTDAMMGAVQGETWQPWTQLMTQGSVAGGHCIPVVGYDDQFLYAVTWGQVQKITYPAWHAMSTEAWAVLSGELAAGDGRGINVTVLQADLDDLAR
jgi:hypothetical protein